MNAIAPTAGWIGRPQVTPAIPSSGGAAPRSTLNSPQRDELCIAVACSSAHCSNPGQRACSWLGCANQAAVVARLEAVGLKNPRIQGQVQPYSINHNVARGEWALDECQACHTIESRPNQRSLHVRRLRAVVALAADLVIILLLFTGLVIHRPDIFGLFSFRHIVTVHNVLAAILVINAGLSLFWHLASGEIRPFIPRPYSFFDNAIVQAKYCLQGIFKEK